VASFAAPNPVTPEIRMDDATSNSERPRAMQRVGACELIEFKDSPPGWSAAFSCISLIILCATRMRKFLHAELIFRYGKYIAAP
jgi:hypothetical protein